MSDITFQQIQAFLEIAKCRSLSKAASEMFISQPALSKMLRRLEAGIGLQLFTRNNQGVELTESGKGMYLAFKSLYDNLELTINWAKRMTFARKYLNIAVPVNYDYSDSFLPLKSIISRYEDKYPEINVVETLFEMKPLCQSLEFGGFDLVFVPNYAMENIMYVKRRRVFEFQYSIAVPEDFPAADLSDPTPLNDVILFAMPSADDLNDTRFAERVCKEIGFTPGEIRFPPNSETILHAVRYGRGVGLCWPVEHHGELNGIRYLPILREFEYTHLDVVWNPDKLSQEAQWFLNMLPHELHPDAPDL